MLKQIREIEIENEALKQPRSIEYVHHESLEVKEYSMGDTNEKEQDSPLLE